MFLLNVKAETFIMLMVTNIYPQREAGGGGGGVRDSSANNVLYMKSFK